MQSIGLVASLFNTGTVGAKEEIFTAAAWLDFADCCAWPAARINNNPRAITGVINFFIQILLVLIVPLRCFLRMLRINKIIHCRAQEIKLDQQGDQYDDGEHGKIFPETAGVGRFSQEVRDERPGKYAGHIHEAIGGRPVFGGNKLAKDRHVVGIKHAKAETETEGGSYDMKE